MTSSVTKMPYTALFKEMTGTMLAVSAYASVRQPELKEV